MRVMGCCSRRTPTAAVAAVVAALVCGPPLLAAGVAGAAQTTTTLARTTTTTLTPQPSTTTTTSRPPQPSTTTTLPTPAPQPSTTTTGVQPADLRRTTRQHDDGAAARGQSAEPRRPHTTHRGSQRPRGPVPVEQWAVLTRSGPGAPTFLHSPGGPYLYDANGRIVLLHGTNVVYKHAPFMAYPDPGKPWDFSATDAARMRSLGFNVVRLGIEWQALEPGSGGPNQAKICSPGPPGTRTSSTAQWPSRYLRHVAATVQLLGRYGIYTLLDMHRTSTTRTSTAREHPTGPCAPTTCRSCPSGGRWSNNYANPQIADGRAALLVQRRGRRPPGQSRPRLGDCGGTI